MIVPSVQSACAVLIMCMAVIIIMIQSVRDCAVIMRSCGRLLMRPVETISCNIISVDMENYNVHLVLLITLSCIMHQAA